LNAFSPGPIETPGLSGLGRNEEEVQQLRSSLLAAVPMGRLVSSDEIAKAAVFLASEDSSYVTGIELFVDGGTAQI
jgi:NAD(P)-dependent dehydrogenase (short-subunit alcohol dehydrogenase family)